MSYKPLPVREQLRMGWQCIRWVFWAKGEPAWVNITILIAGFLIWTGMYLVHSLWPIAAAIVLVVFGIPVVQIWERKRK